MRAEERDGRGKPLLQLKLAHANRRGQVLRGIEKERSEDEQSF